MKQTVCTLLTGVFLGATLFGGAEAAAEGYLARRSEMPFFVNGSPVTVDAYLIGENNYLKLRDIAALADFGVTWSPESGAVLIDTMVGYFGEFKPTETESTASQQESAVSQPNYHEKANASAFDSAYTAETYDALRQCMADGQSVPITMSAETRAAMQGVTAAISSYPSYDLKPDGNGAAHFQRKYSSAYENAARTGQVFLDTLAGKSADDKLYAIACYVCDRLEYDESSTATPRTLFATDGVKKGNCMSYAHGFQYMCNLANIPCILVHSDVHQWDEVYTNGRWYSVDLTGFKIGYSERGSATLLHDSSELIGSMYTQSEPQLKDEEGRVSAPSTRAMLAFAVLSRRIWRCGQQAC